MPPKWTERKAEMSASKLIFLIEAVEQVLLMRDCGCAAAIAMQSGGPLTSCQPGNVTSAKLSPLFANFAFHESNAPIHRAIGGVRRRGRRYFGNVRLRGP